MHRRTFVTAGVTGGILFLAGCAGGGEDPPENTTTTTTESSDIGGVTTTEDAYDPETVETESPDATIIFDRPMSYAYTLTGEMATPYMDRGPVTASGRVDANGNIYERSTMVMYGQEVVTETYFVDGTAYDLADGSCEAYGEFFSPGQGGYAGFDMWETPIVGYGITEPTGTETVGGELSDIYEFDLEVDQAAAEAADSAISGAGTVSAYRLRFAVGTETGYLRRVEIFQTLTLDGGEYLYDFTVDYDAFDEDHTVGLPGGC